MENLIDENKFNNDFSTIENKIIEKKNSNGKSSFSCSMINDSLKERKQFRQDLDQTNLPETIKILHDEQTNGKIYLVGTAHFSEKSQDDVSKIIEMTQPDLVMLELCSSRINILSLDEETLIRESSTMNFSKLRTIIKMNGVIHGLIHVLLLNLSAHLTKQLGMAPGGEFRMAFRQARKIPGCQIVLGDRPVGITLRRAMNSLSIWKKFSLVWSLITSEDKITNEDVEKCKEHDILERLLLEMSDQYPELSRVFVNERDQYLSYSLRKCIQPIPIETNSNGFIPSVVVAVVGIGHLQGIIHYFNQRNSIENIENLLKINENSSIKSNRLSTTLKYLGVGTAILLFIYQWNRLKIR